MDGNGRINDAYHLCSSSPSAVGCLSVHQLFNEKVTCHRHVCPGSYQQHGHVLLGVESSVFVWPND